MLIHDKVRPVFICDHCNHQFSKKDKLKWHIFRQMLDNCTICDVSFATTWGREVHMLEHNEQHTDDFTVSFTQFAHAWNLQKTPLVKKDKTKLSCGYCQEVFATGKKLKKIPPTYSHS